MVSTFFGLNIGYRGLTSHQLALDVTGHNIANANTEGYSRQRAQLVSGLPLTNYGGPGQLGSGAEVAQITRLRDIFIDLQIRRETQTLGNGEALQTTLSQIEGAFAEPSDSSLNSVLSQFWDAWQELSLNPESLAVRANLKESGQTLASAIGQIYNNLETLQTGLNDEIKSQVDQVNNLATQIRDLNKQIVRIESTNDNANDLRDRRDLLVDQLASLVNISVKEQPNGAYVINIQEKALVENDFLNPLLLERNADNNYFYDIKWSDDNQPVKIVNGQLHGLIQGRDEAVPSFMEHLDKLAVALIDQVNESHNLGFGLDGSSGIDFFTPYRQATRGIAKVVALPVSSGSESIHDPDLPLNGDTTNDTTDNYEADPLVPASGSFIINRTTFTFDAATDSLNSLIGRINAADIGVIARLDAHNRLTISATPEGYNGKEYSIFNIADSSGNLMQRLGLIDAAIPPNIIAGVAAPPEAGAAKRMAVSVDILEDLNKIAADAGHLQDSDNDGSPDSPNVWIASGPGDGTHALNIAQLANSLTMLKGNATFDDYYKSMIAELGVQSQEATRLVDNQTLLKDQLVNRRESVSGINLDEEMTNMVRFQQGYQAAAKVIQTMDRLYDTIIGLIR